MSKTPKKIVGKARHIAAKVSRAEFDEILSLIEAARTRAVAAVNTTLIDLYWTIGEHISRRIAREGWGKGTVEELAWTIQRRYPGMSGYSASNLWRMTQFVETYREQPKLATLLRELSWSHFVELIRLEDPLKRDFYAEMCRTERWSVRTLTSVTY